jgi:hypothetical protein
MASAAYHRAVRRLWPAARAGRAHAAAMSRCTCTGCLVYRRRALHRRHRLQPRLAAAHQCFRFLLLSFTVTIPTVASFTPLLCATTVRALPSSGVLPSTLQQLRGDGDERDQDPLYPVQQLPTAALPSVMSRSCSIECHLQYR